MCERSKKSRLSPLVMGSFSLKEVSPQKPELSPPKNALYMCRRVNCSFGDVAFVGHCIAKEEQIVEQVDIVEETGDLLQFTYLPGSYITIITGSSEVTILADLSGQFPLYYSIESDKIRYSSSIEALVIRQGSMEIDLDMLGIAAELLSRVPYQSFTPYRNIYRLLGGHALKLTTNGASTEPYDSLIPESKAAYAAAVDELRDSLCMAISARMSLGCEVGADFSGGLDSTSLTFLAAGLLGEDQSIKAFHSRHIEEPDGDILYAERFSRLDSRIDLRLIISPAERLPFQNLRSNQKYELPNPTATRAIATDYLQEVADSGCKILLSGVCGDELLSVDATYLADLYKLGPLRNGLRIIRDVTLKSQLDHMSAVKVLKWVRNLSKVTLKQSLQRYAEVLRCGISSWHTWIRIDERGIQLLSHQSRMAIADFLLKKPIPWSHAMV